MGKYDYQGDPGGVIKKKFEQYNAGVKLPDDFAHKFDKALVETEVCRILIAGVRHAIVKTTTGYHKKVVSE